METLSEKLTAYQHELGALRSRQRAFEVQAAEIGQRAALIEARIAGIQEAVDLLQAEEVERKADKQPAAKRRQRPLSGPWKAIMTMADHTGEYFDYDDLERFALAIGHSAGRDTMRSQMSGYKAAGLVEPVGDGKFAVTDVGRAAAGIEKPEERETTRDEQREYDNQIASLETQPYDYEEPPF